MERHERKKRRAEPYAKRKEDGGASSLHGDFAMNKALGQNLLVNAAILTGIVEKAGVRSTDVVLEIGPGTGNLTSRLLEKARQVVAIEVDPRMAMELTKRFAPAMASRKLIVIQGDVLDLSLPSFDICVANIPYQISSPLTFKLLTHTPSFRSAVLMYQKEFGQRILAQPGDSLYCRLSVNCQLLAHCEQLMKVNRSNFRPMPKVDSVVVRLDPKNPPPPISFIEWDGLVRLCFSRKNKTVGSIFKQKEVLSMVESNIRTLFGLRNEPVPQSVVADVKAYVMDVLDRAGFTEKRSAHMPQIEFMQLLSILNAAHIHLT